MGSFGSSSSKQKSSTASGIDDRFFPYAQTMLDRSEKVANQGYTQYQGVDVALPQSMINSWQGAANRNAVFNTPGQAAPNVTTGMPIVNKDGIQGLSSYGGYQKELANLQRTSPGLYNYIKSFSIDPKTGKVGSNTMDTQVPPANNPNQFQMPQFSLQQLIQQGMKSGGGMGAQMAFMGMPYLSRGPGGGASPMQWTSAYKQLFDRYSLMPPGDPYAGALGSGNGSSSGNKPGPGGVSVGGVSVGGVGTGGATAKPAKPANKKAAFSGLGGFGGLGFGMGNKPGRLR